MQHYNENTPLLNSDAKTKKAKYIAFAAISTAILAAVGTIIGLSVRKQQSNTFLSNLGIANNSTYLWKLTGNNGKDGSCTDSKVAQDCYSQLNYLAEQWVGLADKTAWYDVEYEVFDPTGNYLGRFGISLTSTAVTVSNSRNLKVTIGPYQAGNAQQIDISTPSNNCDIKNNAQPQTGLKAGVNLSGLEWGNNAAEIVLPSCDDIKNAINKNFQIFRIPFKLEYASTDGQTINSNSAYVQYYLALVNQLTSHGYKVIVEPHNYMRFNNKLLSTEQCKNLIGNTFVNLFKNITTPENIILEAMNEPHDLNLQDLATCYDGLIKTARAQSYQGPIVIEGSTWGTPNVWVNSDGSPAVQFTTLSKFFTDKQTYGDVQLGIHTYFNGPYGGGDGSSECVPVNNALSLNHIPQLTTLARQYGIKIFVTELGVIDTANCRDVLNNVMQHFTTNNDVYALYNWWTFTPDLHYWGNSDGARLVLRDIDARYDVLKNYMPHSNEKRALTSSATTLHDHAWLFKIASLAFSSTKNLVNYFSPSAQNQQSSIAGHAYAASNTETTSKLLTNNQSANLINRVTANASQTYGTSFAKTRDIVEQHGFTVTCDNAIHACEVNLHSATENALTDLVKEQQAQVKQAARYNFDLVQQASSLVTLSLFTAAIWYKQKQDKKDTLETKNPGEEKILDSKSYQYLSARSKQQWRHLTTIVSDKTWQQRLTKAQHKELAIILEAGKDNLHYLQPGKTTVSDMNDMYYSQRIVKEFIAKVDCNRTATLKI